MKKTTKDALLMLFTTLIIGTIATILGAKVIQFIGSLFSIAIPFWVAVLFVLVTHWVIQLVNFIILKVGKEIIIRFYKVENNVK
ncbi:MAG: hypothetical protein WC783_03315 [Candidatus Paceibacterota bacterium]|jgi:hypothetical protein